MFILNETKLVYINFTKNKIEMQKVNEQEALKHCEPVPVVYSSDAPLN